MLPGKSVLVFLVLASLLVPAAPAGARVGDEDLRRAAEDLERARSNAGAAGEELTAGRAAAARLRAQLENLADEVASAEVRFADARGEARDRAGAMYVAAGAGSVAGGRGTEAAVRQAYAAAVAARDQEVVNALTAAAADRDRWRQLLQERAREQEVLARRLDEVAGEAGQALAEAEAEYARVRSAWEAQEAARRAAARGGRRARLTTTTTSTTATTTTTSTTAAGGPGATTTTTEAPPAPATTTTTTTGPSPPTTTLPDPVEGGPFPPLVERWRPLVAAYFPAALVDEALAVMRCESLGDPSIVNPVSGAAGLFQHMPRYWPARAAAAGFPGASPLEAEANIAAAAWLVRVSLEDGLPAWYFWSCRP